MSTIQKRVLIIGGGSVGLWLALRLSEGDRPISCAVVDSDPFASFASTRNQGWLQSGAFYAMTDDDEAARACARGYEIIESFAPKALRKKTKGFFLFQTAKADLPAKQDALAVEAVRKCKEVIDLNLSVQTLRVLPDGVLNLLNTESRDKKDKGNLEYAVEVKDCPIDSSMLMSKVATQAAGRGTEFIKVENLEELDTKYAQNRWKVYLDKDRTSVVECELIVLACGVYIPHLMEKLGLSQAKGYTFKRTKIPVLVMQGQGFDALLATPNAKGPSLVPFSAGGISGATVCAYQGDIPITHHSNDSLPDDHIINHKEHMLHWLPGIEKLVAEQTIRAHFYVCQKFGLDTSTSASGAPTKRSHVLLEDSPDGGTPSVLILYPGKMTAAPVAAEICRDRIRILLNAPQSSSIVRRKVEIPRIATQRYYDQPTHQLRADQGDLIFDPI